MLTAKLILERLDKEGRLLERREQRAKSFVKNFIGMLYLPHADINYTSPYSMNDITNTARDTDNTTGEQEGSDRTLKCTLAIGAPAGGTLGYYPGGNSPAWPQYFSPESNGHEGSKVGIQVGTGVVAVTPTDYALATRILHGRAAGQLEYGGCELINIAFVNPNGEFTIRRYFTNHSGGSITINEVGVYATAGKRIANNSGASYIFLIARDLTGGVAVADTEILRATYVPQIAV